MIKRLDNNVLVKGKGRFQGLNVRIRERTLLLSDGFKDVLVNKVTLAHIEDGSMRSNRFVFSHNPTEKCQIEKEINRSKEG